MDLGAPMLLSGKMSRLFLTLRFHATGKNPGKTGFWKVENKFVTKRVALFHPQLEQFGCKKVENGKNVENGAKRMENRVTNDRKCTKMVGRSGRSVKIPTAGAKVVFTHFRSLETHIWVIFDFLRNILFVRVESPFF